MTQRELLPTSFDKVKTTNKKGHNLSEWTFGINNDLNIVDNNPQFIVIVKTDCGGL